MGETILLGRVCRPHPRDLSLSCRRVARRPAFYSESAMTKRVLMVAYLFPPIANSGTQRPLKFAKYLSNYGWQPTVLTAARLESHATDAALLDEIPANVCVVRVPMLNELVGEKLSSAMGGGAFAKRAG